MSSEYLTIKELYDYPVKSMHGRKRNSLDTNLADDRRWAVRQLNGQVVTQREIRELAELYPEVLEDALVISSADKQFSLEAPINYDGLRLETIVWGNKLQGIDQGDFAAKKLSERLGIDCRLILMPEDFIREKRNSKLNYADSYPWTIGLVETFKDLLSRLHAVGETSFTLDGLMRRFRTNMLVEGGDAYEEDRWAILEVGDDKEKIVYEADKDCIRCPMPNIDQNTAVKGKQPGKELLSYRKIKYLDNGKEHISYILCKKAVCRTSGTVYEGQEVRVAEWKESPEFIK